MPFSDINAKSEGIWGGKRDERPDVLPFEVEHVPHLVSRGYQRFQLPLPDLHLAGNPPPDIVEQFPLLIRDLPLIGFVRPLEVDFARPQTPIDDLPRHQFPGRLCKQEHIAEGNRTQRDKDAPIEEEFPVLRRLVVKKRRQT